VEEIFMLPKDPFILLSYVNTKLRDRDADLEHFCVREAADKAELCRRLADAGFSYDAGSNQFK
jgi:hypothetical protein